MIDCKICGEKFKAITNTHLENKHGMSMAEYKSVFNLFRVTPDGWGAKENNSFYGKSHE